MHLILNFYRVIATCKLEWQIRITEKQKKKVIKNLIELKYEYNIDFSKYEGWNFNSGNYLFTTDTK